MKIHFQWNSIASKVSVLLLTTTFILVAILITYSVLVLRDRELVNAKMNAVSFAKDYSGRLKAVIEVPLDGSRALSSALLATKDGNFDARLSREDVNAMLANFLTKNPDVLGTYTCWEANAFDSLDHVYKNTPGHDGTGRFIPYWVRNNGSIQLEPLLNYEVEGAGDYYVLAKKSRRETILDPYVYPVGGKDVLMMSLVTPIVKDNNFFGITGTDISLEWLQQMLEQDRSEIFSGHGELYIISHNATIVASTQSASHTGKAAKSVFPEYAKIQQASDDYSVTEDDVLQVFVPLEIGQSKNAWKVAVTVPVSYLTAHAVNEMIKMVLLSIFFLAAFAVGALFFLKKLVKPIGQIAEVAEDVARGNLQLKDVTATSAEIEKLNSAFIKVVNSQRDITDVCSSIASGDFSRKAIVKSDFDLLAKSVNTMSENLKTASEEDAKRNWTAEGLARFGDLLRQDKDIKGIAESILSNLVRYVHANQGGFFLVEEDKDQNVYLEMIACYAYERKKFLEKRIAPGEGLIGQCYLEQQSIFLKDIPAKYVQITSGLGHATPTCLLIVPLTNNNKIEGVIELATFDEFEKHEIEFIEKVAQSIAATVAGMKINQRTRELLQQSQQQAEELKAQEEEMRQNIEEISATQEEMRRKEIAYTKRIEELERAAAQN